MKLQDAGLHDTAKQLADSMEEMIKIVRWQQGRRTLSS